MGKKSQKKIRKKLKKKKKIEKELKKKSEKNKTKILKISTIQLFFQTANNGYMRRVAPNAMALQSGPDQYEGLLKDLLELLAADLEFDYFLEEDFIHGFPTADGNWTGIIGSLVDRVTQNSTHFSILKVLLKR